MKETLSTGEVITGHEEITRLVDRVLARTTLYRVRVDVRGQRGSRIVEVFVDGDEGVTIDQCAEISRELELLIDTEEVLDGGYRLSVSSPGIDQPIVIPRQYTRHLGRDIKVHVAQPGGDEEVFTGRLVHADASTIKLDVHGEPKVVAIDDIVRAKIELPW
jgi:ribosome maturation factor RimP